MMRVFTREGGDTIPLHHGRKRDLVFSEFNPY